MRQAPDPRPNEREREACRKDPTFQARATLLNAMAAMFTLTGIACFAVLAAGVMPPRTLPPEPIVGWVMLAVAIGELPAMFFFGRLMLQRARSAAAFEEVARQATAAFIVVYACGNAIPIYGVVGQPAGMAVPFQWALVTFGTVVLVLLGLFFRPRVIDLLVKARAAELERRPPSAG